MVVLAELHLALMCSYVFCISLCCFGGLPSQESVKQFSYCWLPFFTSRNVRKCCTGPHFFIFCFELDFLVIFKVVLRNSPPGFLKVSVFLRIVLCLCITIHITKNQIVFLGTLLLQDVIKTHNVFPFLLLNS